MRAKREKKTGDLILRDIPPFMAAVMALLPALLSGDGVDGDVAAASPYEGDDERTEEWLRLAGPELLHLFTSAREVVQGDLASAVPVAGGRRYRVRIPRGHEVAWQSCLAAARIHLAAAHDLEAPDMEADPPAPPFSPRERARILVDHMGWLQMVLLEGGTADTV